MPCCTRGSVWKTGSSAGRGDSARKTAAVDRDQFTIDMIRCVGCEKDRQRSQLGIVARSADWDELAALEESHHLLVVREDAGNDAIGLDVLLRISERERPGQLNYAAL